MYTPTDDPRAILSGLHRRYGTLKPEEKEWAGLKWNSPWNPSDPIESMFFNLEELFVQDVQAGVPYSQAQLLDRGLDNLKKTGLFITAVVEWNGFDPLNKTWNNFKSHITEAYKARLDSGPTAEAAGYHGAAMALSDDNSLGSIAGSLAQMQMTNNANTKVLHDNLSTISTGINELRQALLATQQQVAALTRAINDPNANMQMPAWNQAGGAPPAYVGHQPPPPMYYQPYANAAITGTPPSQPPPAPYIAAPP